MVAEGVKAVLFDIDGTLVNSNGWHVRAWDEAFRGQGFELRPASIAAQIGKGGDMLVPTLAPDAPRDVREALSTAHDEIFKGEYLEQVEPIAGARDLVERVHRDGKRVVLASSASKAELKHYVDLLDLGRFVDASTTSDDVKHSKPAPDIFGEAVRKAKVDPAHAIAIGDSPFDIIGARRAGVRTIAVLSGGFPRERLADAVAIYDDAAALLAAYGNSALAG